jgi:hypothetical protein
MAPRSLLVSGTADETCVKNVGRDITQQPNKEDWVSREFSQTSVLEESYALEVALAVV